MQLKNMFLGFFEEGNTSLVAGISRGGTFKAGSARPEPG